MVTSLAEIVRPFASQLRALLQVFGHALPLDDRSAVTFTVAARVFGLDGKGTVASCQRAAKNTT